VFGCSGVQELSTSPRPSPSPRSGRPGDAGTFGCGEVRTASIFCLMLWLTTACLGAAQAQRRASAPPRHSVISPWDVEAREYLGTPESEAAVNSGLAYLAAHQQPDGHWSSGGYPSDTGITGLCLLSFLAAGHQPNRGRYGLTMSEAVDWLAKCVQRGGQYTPAGFINAGSGSGQPMYGHGFATLALCEVYGMTHRKDLKPKIEAAIRLIEDSQTDDTSMTRAYGGWRYQPMKGDADISVTVVQVLALRAARNAGLHVSQATIDRAINYMRRCSNYVRGDGGFNYQVGQQLSGPARTGAGVLSLMMAGLKDSPECRGGIQYLETHRLGSGNDWPYREHYYYTLYYITQAMYQVGGEHWKQWYPMVRDRLLRERSADGSWSSGSEAGAEYATAMSILVLQVPAGLLPIYQK
jgi:hypothetical protein